MSPKNKNDIPFSGFPIDPRLLANIAQLGFETPTPIQVQTIPWLLEGCDLLGQAQTGTGKTAAFGLPLLHQINVDSRATQALVLAPTRELAIQVARALQQFSVGLSGLRVTPIYGGQAYALQLRALSKGAQVVVGTPGRIMDHLRRGSLKLDSLKTIVLDEADEMLNMGFVEDVEWILGHCPQQHQTSLFSATLPPRIRRLAAKYLHTPKQICLDEKLGATPNGIRQRYWLIRGLNKLDALSRILEAEILDAGLIFVRTKAATVELAQQLVERSFLASALHGDMPQNLREQTVLRLKEGKIDLLVATDVAARGLDIERFGHVINYDMPSDVEAYVHRIGRTGRAGRGGQAISLVAPRERHLLRAIEQRTKQNIDPMDLPSAATLNQKRIQTFKQSIRESLDDTGLDPYLKILQELCQEESLDPLKMAAALAQKAQGKLPLLVKEVVVPVRTEKPLHRSDRSLPEPGMDRYRLAVGHVHGVNPSHIVGAIANSSGLKSRHIGRITIHQDHSLVDLTSDMPQRVFQLLKNIRICQVPMAIRRLSDAGDKSPSNQRNPRRLPHKLRSPKSLGSKVKKTG